MFNFYKDDFGTQLYKETLRFRNNDNERLNEFTKK